MTSIAEPRPAAEPEPASGTGERSSWLRTVLLIALLVLLAPIRAPWSWLWLGVPATVACALLLTWRFGTLAAALVMVGTVALVVAGAAQSLWAWWIPAVALVGAWMGRCEEGTGPSSGQLAWMLVPALVLAAALPWLARYDDFVAALGHEMTVNDTQLMDALRQLGLSSERLSTVEKLVSENATQRSQLLPLLVPTLLFLWITVLVAAGRALAARIGRLLRWPRLSRAQVRDWRLPDGALWVFIAGLALLVAPWASWRPTGWTLLLGAGLGYCVQGMAVAQSLMLARGVPPPFIILTMLFLFMFLMPYFVLGAVALGLSDVWLDYRRLEPVADGDPNQGDR